jgi:hypothetical protein
MPQPTDKATIRRATARDGEVLTSTVRGASAYAGEYRKIVRDVRISPEQIRRDHVYLCELDGEVAGFYALVSDEGGAELDFRGIVKSCGLLLDHAATFSVPSTNSPFLNSAPALTSATK